MENRTKESYKIYDFVYWEDIVSKYYFNHK